LLSHKPFLCADAVITTTPRYAGWEYVYLHQRPAGDLRVNWQQLATQPFATNTPDVGTQH